MKWPFNKIYIIIYFCRRAHLKDCFDSLKAEVPCQRDRKITNLQVLNLAIKYIQVGSAFKKNIRMTHR